MPVTQLELELKNTAAERIRRRLLPAEAPQDHLGRTGDGKTCLLCDRAVDSTETEYELNAHMEDGTQSTIRFHLWCHARRQWKGLAWRRTRDRCHSVGQMADQAKLKAPYGTFDQSYIKSQQTTLTWRFQCQRFAHKG